MTTEFRTELHSRLGLDYETPDTMKLLVSSERRIRKNKNIKNVPHLGITEVVLINEILN